MKVCSKCSEAKSESEFYIKDSKSGRLHTQCKQCYKTQRVINYQKHYLQYGDAYRARAKERRLQFKTKFHQKMLDYLADKHCEFCKENDNRVLEFDHLDPTTKKFGISEALRYGYSWDVTLAEIAKCRILCANCHKKRTATQFNWYKT